MDARTGSCLCKAVRIVANLTSKSVGACHCAMCRKWSGGPLLSAQCDGSITFEGEEHITTFRSSDWAERGFCRHCGTHLFYHLKQTAHYAIPVGLFDSDSGWQLTDQIFIDQKPAFYSFAEPTKNLTAAEVFAQFAPK